MVDHREEWIAFRKKEKEEKMGAKRVTSTDAANFRHMSQASIALADMTKMASWDLFLRYLQSAKEAWEADRSGILHELLSPAMTESDVLNLRLRAARMDERVRLLALVINLPNELITMGDQARGIIDRMDEEDAKRRRTLDTDRLTRGEDDSSGDGVGPDASAAAGADGRTVHSVPVEDGG